MSIQSKIGSLLAVLFLVLIATSAGILYTVVAPEFASLDRENTIHRSQQIQNTLHDELEDLKIYSSDWGVWDDTYKYMVSKDPEFIAGSAPDDTFLLTDIHLMAFYDMNNDIVWGRWFDKNSDSFTDLEITFVDNKTRAVMSPQAVVANNGMAGFAQTTRGPMMIAAHPILKSNQDGPARGIAITGRYLDQTRMAKIAEDLNAEFNTVFSLEQSISEKQNLPIEVISDPLQTGAIGLYDDQDNHMLYSYVDIIAMNDIKLMRLVHPHPMEILDKGQFAIATVLQLLAAFFAIALFFIVVSLHKIVLNPLGTLRKKIGALKMGNTIPTEAISETQSNELLLALESFDAMESEIRQYQSDLEDKVRDRTHWLQETNDRLEEEVAERQRTEEHLLAAKVEAEQSSRSKSEFLATMSHEIRTPMNGVVGMTNLLLESKLDEEQVEYTNSIKNSADHLLLLINDILDISKLEAGVSKLEISSFSLPGILESVTSAQRPKASSKNLALISEIDPDLPEWVKSDPTRLRQVLFNLVGNAIKFTDTGYIKITVTPHKPRAGSTQWIKCSVEDTGIGISDGDQDRIFERFTQADGSSSRRHGGAGLGLSIVKRLSKQMSGEIGLESSLGNGSTFWFTVPLEVAEPTQNEDPTTQTAPSARNNASASTQVVEPVTLSEDEQLHVLIAEDNKINQMLLTKFFTKRGHKSDVAFNGLEALEYLKHQNPDIILMDIQMPEMDGIEATKAIRALEGAKSQIPIVAVTANAMKGDRDTYIAAGMNDYVAKPVDFKRLMDVIEQNVPAKVS
ncbi:ATP-binding protein [Kiloniella majae]|uniref:ATP-binding protein n=1 Tax=Kiloniella majae TaxID=1938558 RepID=UPI000A2783D7|nr:ATP-binding protein [Kiloniella majae]